MQAIVVKYIGPTNTRGSKMRASACKGIKPINRPYDSELSVELNARQAAQDFIKQQGWYPHDADMPNLYNPFWAMGTLPNGDYVFVAHSANPYHDSNSIDTRSW